MCFKHYKRILNYNMRVRSGYMLPLRIFHTRNTSQYDMWYAMHVHITGNTFRTPPFLQRSTHI
jgi:hypothetical protein